MGGSLEGLASRSPVGVGFVLLIVVAVFAAPVAPATHEEPPVKATGTVPDAEWVSLAFTVGPRAHVEVAFAAPEGTLDDLPIGAGVRVYDPAGGDKGSTTVVDMRGFYMWWSGSDSNGYDTRHGYWWHGENGTGHEIAVAFKNLDDAPLDLRAMLWLTSSPGPREWIVKSDGPVDVVNVTHGDRALLHLEDSWETWSDPDVPALNHATGLDTMQYEHAALNVTFTREWHGDVFGWPWPRTCVDVEDLPLPLCSPVNPRPPLGVGSKRHVDGPPGAGHRDGPAGEYSFRHSWYRYYPYECAGPACAGEREENRWYEPLALSGVDAPLAAFPEEAS